MMRVSIVLTMLTLTLATLAAPASRLYYTGTMGVRAIQIDLSFEKRRVELEPEWKTGQVYGSFQFDDGALHYLAGRARGGQITLDERFWYDDGARPRSTFTGRLSADRKSLTGTWMAAGGAFKQAFAADAVAEYRNIRLPRRRMITLTGAYPVFYQTSPSLRALERSCRQQIETALQRFRTTNWDAHDGGFPFDYYDDVTFNLAYFTPKLVSLRVEDNTYTGGAHGYEDTTGQTYLITGEGPVQLGLQDIFNRQTRYMDALMDLVLADLVRQSVAPGDRNLRGFAWDDLSPEVMNVYTVSKTGITFIFPPYVMASYAEGTLTATLPFAAFNGYLAHTNVTPLLRVESFTPPAPGAQDTTDALRLHMQTAWAAAALPKPQRDSYLQASNIIRKLAAAREGLRQAQAESYVWVQVYQLDNLEHGQTLAAIVQALRNPVADPAARERAHASLTAAEIQAKALLIPANTPVERTAYANYSRSLLYGLADLTLALPGWPDQVAEVVCGYVGKVMGPDTEAETE